MNKMRKIGPWEIPALGLGCMPLSGLPHTRLNMPDDREGALGVLHTAAELKGVSPFALTISWHLHTSPSIIPIPGATKNSCILDSLKGMDVELTVDEMAVLNAGLPENPEGPDDLFAQLSYRGISN